MTPAQKNFDYRRYLIFRLSENFKFKEIAEFMGIERTTIYHYLKTHKQLIEVDKNYQKICSSKTTNNIIDAQIQFIKERLVNVKNPRTKKRKLTPKRKIGKL